MKPRFILVKTPFITLSNGCLNLKSVLIVLGIIILILQIRLLSSDGGIGEYLALKEKLQVIHAKVDELEQQNQLLKKEVQDLQSNTDAIETIARQKLGMIGEDEVFVKVIELSPVESKPESVESISSNSSQ